MRVNKGSSIAVLVTCHNRRKLTLKFLEELYKQEGIPNINIDIYLVDDGSTDGTSNAVKEQFPEVNILEGDGSLFWTGGMRKAMRAAIKNGYDFYLWANDDVKLYSNALAKSIQAYYNRVDDSNNGIVVGSLCDPNTGKWTYGASKKESSWHPLRFKPILPGEEIKEADNFWGNFVLIPNEVVEKIGNLDKKLVHGRGDHDYALRAKRSGFKIWLVPGYIGECSRNSIKNTWQDPSLKLSTRLKKITSTKSMPFKSRFYFLKKHGGILFPLIFIAPYIKLIFNHIYHWIFNLEKEESTNNPISS